MIVAESDGRKLVVYVPVIGLHPGDEGLISFQERQDLCAVGDGVLVWPLKSHFDYLVSFHVYDFHYDERKFEEMSASKRKFNEKMDMGFIFLALSFLYLVLVCLST